VQLGFVAIDFSPGATMRYQYMLDGIDRDWSAPTDQRTVNYANLSPGAYRFLLRAVNAEGSISTHPAAVSFTILPPLWQSWWFELLAAAAVAGLAYGVYRYRVAQLLALERVRMRIATDLHDDIGSSLSHIVLLSEVARRQAGQDSVVAESLRRIAGVSGELVDSMSDIVWAINPQKDRLRDMLLRMRHFAGEVFLARGLPFQFQAFGGDPDLRLGIEMRRQILLIFKEAVHNIVRHSYCTEASIEFGIEGEHLLLRLRDNGRGFEVSQETDGHGLMSMRQRAKDLQGEIEIVSRDGQGTTIALRVPLEHRTRSVPTKCPT
jgi:signal transduction histidine kinase